MSHPYLLFLLACVCYFRGDAPRPRLDSFAAVATGPDPTLAWLLYDLRHPRRRVRPSRLKKITSTAMRAHLEARLARGVSARTLENECGLVRRHLRMAGLPPLEASAFGDVVSRARAARKRGRTVPRPSAPGAAHAP